jgi:hypothetical protein
VDAELRQILERVGVSGPATRAELRDLIEQRGGRFSGRAVAEATEQVSSDRSCNQPKPPACPILRRA